jgi:hypothetical protein
VGKLLSLAVKFKLLFQTGIACVLLFFGDALSAVTTTDSALWAGGLFLLERDDGLDYSMEYQLRLDDHMSSFSSNFAEFMGYKKTRNDLLFYGGYRFTMRPEDIEHRVHFGGFWDLTRIGKPVWEDPNRFKAVLQIGYQHDFNVKFDDRLMDSNSIRWVLVGSKPATDRITPFFLAGVLSTWNDACNFGIDKMRLGGGFSWKMTKHSRLRCQYIFEEARFMTPKKHTNIIWIRYEMNLGK